MTTHTFTRALQTLLLLIVFSSFSYSNAIAGTANDPTANEVKNTMLQFRTAVSNADIAFIENAIANDPEALIIGSDPTEIASGHNAVVGWWQGLFSYLSSLGYPNGSLPTVSNGNDFLQLSYKDGVAWVAEQLVWQFAHGNVPFRVTTVLKKEQGQWKIVQQHFSVGSANANLPL